MNYSEFAQLPSSEKVVLAWLQAAQRLMVWTVHSGSVYRKTVPEFVTRVVQSVVGSEAAGTVLTEVASAALVNSAGKWHFDLTTKILYLRTTDSADPDTVFIRADYRIFVSNAPFILPWDLSAGGDVEYLPILRAAPDFRYEIDPEQFGVSLQSIGELGLHNNHGYFDDKYERYWWENKEVQVFSWSPKIPISQKARIYRGIIFDKAFTSTAVTFQVRDFVAKLQGNLALPQFDGSEGILPQGFLGAQKRRIYGRVSGLRCVGLDQVLDGYQVSGGYAGRPGTNQIAGDGDFFDQVSPGDDLIHRDKNYRVDSVPSSGLIVLTTEIEEVIDSISFPGALLVRPKIPWRKKNREWLIAGHALKKISAEITEVISARRFRVDDPTEFDAGDLIQVGASSSVVRRKSGDLIILTQNLNILPIVGNIISRAPVQAVNIGTTDLVVTRDYTVTNSVNGAVLVLNELAEFNLARPFTLTGSLTFTNGSRSVTGGALFTKELHNRSWVRAPLGTWYEVLNVIDDNSLELRVPFAQVTAAGVVAEGRVPIFFDDESKVTVNCFGKTEDGDEDGVWIKTGPQVVKDLLSEAGISDAIDDDAFDVAIEDAPHMMSMALPQKYGPSSGISIKDAIDLVGQTVQGALSYGEDYDLEYNILTSKKPTSLVALQEEDVEGWRSESRVAHIVKDMYVNYRHEDADRYTGADGFSTKKVTNETALRLSDTQNSKTVSIYLYDEAQAEITARRLALMSESASTVIIVKAKLNITTMRLAEKAYVNLERLFYRLGSSAARRKIGVIIKITRDGTGATIEFDDLSGIWNKVANITANDADVYSAADEDQRARNGYLTSETGIIPGNDFTYRTNLIG
jgi:hypothetical protein